MYECVIVVCLSAGESVYDGVCVLVYVCVIVCVFASECMCVMVCVCC